MISWIIAAGVTVLVGAIVTTFIEMLKEWAKEIISAILINLSGKLIKVISDAIVYIIKKGKKYYREIKIRVKKRIKIMGLIPINRDVIETRTMEINKNEIPKDLLSQVDRFGKKEVLRQKVR